MPRILLEDTCGEFIVDRSKPLIRENLGSGGSVTRIPGRLSICDEKNGNNRKYPRRVWEKNLAENSPLKESIKRNAAFGLLEHPSDGKVDLRSNIAVLTTKAQLEGQDVTGEITVLGTADGQKLMALIEAGYNPLVSSRGFGTLTRLSDGIDEVQEDYVCEGWDVVMTPSFQGAQLQPQRNSAPAQTIITTTESQIPAPPAAPALPAPPAISDKPKATPQAAKQPTMDITKIKESLQALKAAVSPDKLTPGQLAENMAKVESLHHDIARFVAEDATRTYEGMRLHKQLEDIETAWQSSITESRRQGDKAVEHNSKLLKVMKAVVESGLTYKTKLAEKTSLVSQLVERGRAWKKRAEMLESKLKVTEKRADLAYASLDELVEQYNEATTALGRRIIEMEFKEKAETPEIQQALKEAKKPKHLVAIREKLEGVAPAAAAPAAPAPPAPAPAHESMVIGDPRFVGESLEIVRRLSAAAAVPAA